MDVNEIVYISAVGVPVVATVAVMIFVYVGRKKFKSVTSDHQAEAQIKEELIHSMEKVIKSQDRTLEEYRNLEEV